MGMVKERVAAGSLTWTVREDGGIYMVSLAEERNVHDLAKLESEFIEDHQHMLKGTSHSASHANVAKLVGLRPSMKERKKVISTIVKRHGKTYPAFTLKCAYLPGFKNKDAHEIVGYLFVRVTDEDQERQPQVILSHLKVDRNHMRRGCAKLLVAGAVRQLERLKIKLKDTYRKNWELSVLARNRKALSLYRTLGFKKVGTSAVSSRSKLSWARLALKRDDATSSFSHASEWLSKVPSSTAQAPLFVQAPVARAQQKRPRASSDTASSDTSPLRRPVTRSMTAANKKMRT